MTNEIILAIIGSGALSALVSGFFNIFMKRKEKDEGLTAGVRILLYDSIKTKGYKYKEHNSIRRDQLEDLMRMHKIYHDDLGGNGFLDELMADVKDLPVV